MSKLEITDLPAKLQEAVTVAIDGSISFNTVYAMGERMGMEEPGWTDLILECSKNRQKPRSPAEVDDEENEENQY